MHASSSEAAPRPIVARAAALLALVVAGTARADGKGSSREAEGGVVSLDEGDYTESDMAGGPAGDADADAGGRPSGMVELIGRLHPPIVHFAIAWSVLALPFAILRLRRPQTGRIDLAVLAAATVAAAAAVATGIVHSGPFESNPQMKALVDPHEAAGIAALAMLTVALLIRIVLEKRWIQALAWAYAILLGALLVLVPLVGHLGGRMTFGPGFLSLP